MRPGPALLVLLAAAAAGCAAAPSSRAPVDPRTRIPAGIRGDWLHFADSSVEVGGTAPDFTLPTPDGRTRLSLSTFRGRPLVVVFGSYT
jgi:cytochrome oxidase Cu insertion factor (SCO1/SenC/PrrC family)